MTVSKWQRPGGPGPSVHRTSYYILPDKITQTITRIFLCTTLSKDKDGDINDLLRFANSYRFQVRSCNKLDHMLFNNSFVCKRPPVLNDPWRPPKEIPPAGINIAVVNRMIIKLN